MRGFAYRLVLLGSVLLEALHRTLAMPPSQRGSARDAGEYHIRQRRQGEEEAAKQGSWHRLALFLPDCECVAEVSGDEYLVVEMMKRTRTRTRAMIRICFIFDEKKRDSTFSIDLVLIFPFLLLSDKRACDTKL